MELFKLFGSIVIDTDGAEKSVDRVTSKARSSTKETGGFFSKVGKGFTGMAKGVGSFIGKVGGFKLVNGAMNMITGSMDSAISRVDTLNQFPRVLQQMGYSADDAQGSIGKLSDGIDGLPTKLDDIASTTQRMITIFGDVDMATESTLALNNAFLASGASGEDASRGMDQYMKMLSVGKVDMQSWRTLQETMPYALNETAEAFGFAGASAQNDLYDALKEGEITIEEFNEKIIELSGGVGGFAEVAKGATRGIATSMQNLRTMVSRNVANIIQAFDEWLTSNGFGGIPEIIDSIKDKGNEMFGVFIKRIPEILDSILSFTSAIKTLLSGTAEEKELIKEKFVIKSSEMIEKGKEVVSNFLKGMFEKLPEIAEFASGIVVTMIEKYKENYPTIAKTGSEILVKLIEGITKAIPTLAEIAVTIVVSLVEMILSNAPHMMEAGGEILKAIIEGVVEVLPDLAELAVTLLTGLASAINQNLPMILEVGGEILLTLIKGIIDMLPDLADIAVTIVTFISSIVMENLPELITVGWEILKSIAKGIVEAIPGLSDTAYELITGLSTAITDNLPRVGEIGGNILDSLVKGLEENKNKIPEMASEVIGNITSAITENLPDMVTAGVELLLGLLNGMMEDLPEIADNMGVVVAGIIEAILENLPALLEAGAEIIATIGLGMLEAVPKLLMIMPTIHARIGKALRELDWLQIGKDMILGIGRGITAGIGGLVTRVKEAGQAALGGSKEDLKVKSPSRVFADEVGKWIPAGIALGIEANSDLPMDALNKVMSIEGYDFGATIGGGKNKEGSGSSGNTNQTININSPKHLNAIETAREFKKANRELVFG